jgi:shikimate dehydrogenase
MNLKRFGLIGKNISYSFSKNYFKNKFEENNIKDSFYDNYDIETIEKFPECISQNPELIGLNVTIPYKEVIIAYLDELSEVAKKIGAVNTIKIEETGKLVGYNTDYFGFQKSIENKLLGHHKKALILGTGGASKAISYALSELNIAVTVISRIASKDHLDYSQITPEIIQENQLIINCTPIGTSPKIEECVSIPYESITNQHFVIDLIYNPSETLFLKKAKSQGAQIQNGHEMLIQQAEKSWEIWNKKT